MAGSDALGSELISRTVGYKITKGDFSDTTPNLPQRIAVLGEVNQANQTTYPTIPTQITSAQKAGELYGFGSPIHMAARILLPVFSSGVGGIPVIVYPQAEADSATAKSIELTITGTVTVSGKHTVIICGRRGIDGETYDFNVSVGDTPTEIASKITDVINNNIYSPVSATSAAGVVTATAKWNGVSGGEIQLRVDKNDNEIGVTYAVVTTVAGAGLPSVSSSLELFGQEWNTIVVNTYSLLFTDILDQLELYNGIPDPDAPSGRYSGQVMRPFIALTGSTSDNNTAITELRKNNVTIAVCPAPLSEGMGLEAAANMAVLFSRIGQDTPHLDVSGRFYPDMPTPASIGTMATYSNRDLYVKKGNSTVDLVSGRFKIMDFITTYHPIGETVPQFRYCRNLMLDFNVKFGYSLLENIYVIDKAIASNESVVEVGNVIKPKIWVGIINSYADDLGKRGLITDVSFMKESITAELSGVNPDRIETFFRYKRTGFVRLAATTAEAGFNFG